MSSFRKGSIWETMECVKVHWDPAGLLSETLSWAVEGPNFFDDAAAKKVIPRISTRNGKNLTQVVFPVLDGLCIEISGDAPA